MLSDNDVSSSENLELEQEKITFRRKYNFHIKIFAFLSLLILLFLTISVISYNKSDIERSSVSFIDLYGLFTGEPEILARQATTQNWLGLFGVFLSDMLINKTFGYPVIILLFLGMYLSTSLFRRNLDARKLVLNSLFWILTTFFISGFLGTIRGFSWLGEIPFEWCGLVGYFLAFVISSFMGSYGAFFLFLFAIFITIFYKLEFKVTDIIKYAYLSSKNYFDNRKTDENINTEVENNHDKNKVESKTDLQTSPEISNSNLQYQTKAEKKHVVIPLNPLEIVAENDDRIETRKEEPNKFTPKIHFIDPSKIALSNKQIEEELKKDYDPRWSDSNNESFEDEQPNFEVSYTENNSIQDIDGNQQNRDKNTEEIKIPENKNFEDIKEIESIIDEFVSNNANKVETPVQSTQKTISIDIKETTPSIQSPSVLPCKSKLEELKTMFYSEHSEFKIKYKFPSISNLIRTEVDTGFDYAEFETNAKILQEKLETFKVYIENIEITPGPVVTLYEFVPAPGIKISRIESFADDIEMALKAKGVRIIAPMPGKGTVGVEIPNSKPKIVRFGDVVASERYRKTDARLPLAFGKTISGEVFIEDLTKMPHLLIAGATGTGKSVGINTIINSLLFAIHPQNLKFVIIDPKKVEMPQYRALSQHYLATSPDVESMIITNPKDAVLILKSCVIEMENRYEVLADAGQRNIVDYNKKIAEGKLRQSDKIKHAPMPYLVIIIDELADLMLTASKEIEEPITRLAQMARAVGIHLIVATQRPSVDVITGLIKANFPARLAYMTTSKIDSRTILDQQGAEQLLGAGDMLILPPGKPKPIRVQNAFITTEEVEKICEEIAQQEGYPEPYLLPTAVPEENEEKYIDPNDRDPLFQEAARLVVSSRQASVSMLQRRMKIGFARAGRIMDELEAAGIVGSSRGSKTRDVLLESESELEAYL